MQDFSFLACLEAAEKFVVGWWGGVAVGRWSRPSLGFSFSQAKQKRTDMIIGQLFCVFCDRRMNVSFFNDIFFDKLQAIHFLLFNWFWYFLVSF